MRLKNCQNNFSEVGAPVHRYGKARARKRNCIFWPMASAYFWAQRTKAGAPTAWQMESPDHVL